MRRRRSNRRNACRNYIVVITVATAVITVIAVLTIIAGGCRWPVLLGCLQSWPSPWSRWLHRSWRTQSSVTMLDLKAYTLACYITLHELWSKPIVETSSIPTNKPYNRIPARESYMINRGSRVEASRCNYSARASLAKDPSG